VCQIGAKSIMGRIYFRKKRAGLVTWYVDYIYQGQRFRRKVGPSKKLAEIALKDIEVKIAKNEYNLAPSEMTLEDFLGEFDRYSTVNHALESYRRYRNIVNNFRIFLGQKCAMKLSQLTPKLFEDYKIWRRNQPLHKNIVAKTNTVNMEIKTLRTILNYAIKWDFLRDNPTRGVNKLKVIDAKKPRFLSKEEVKCLLENCGKVLYPIFYTFINTGMRLGELINLTWNDVDLENRKIYIQAKEFWRPKTGERTLPMSDGIYQLFSELKGKRKGKTDFVFPGKRGNPLNHKLRNRLITVAKKCGFPDVTKIHTLRHTFASHLVMKGVDLPTVQKLMGHSDIQTTMIYSHLAQDHLNDAINKLDFD
jgi:integrase